MTGPDRSAEIDAAFTRFCADGSPESLATVFEAVAGSLRREARRLLHDDVAAEDLLQATFVAAIELRDRFDVERGGARAWLRGLLRNRALHVVRDRQIERQRAAPAFDFAAAARSEAPARDRSELVELVREVEDAVARLPEPYATAVRRVVLQGESPQRIAEETGQPPATVRSHVRRGLERLRRMLPAVASALARAMAGRGAAVVGVAAVLLVAGLVYVAITWTLDGAAPDASARREPPAVAERVAGPSPRAAELERQRVASSQPATAQSDGAAVVPRAAVGWSLVRAADRTPLVGMPVLWDAGAAGRRVLLSDEAGRLATEGLPRPAVLRLPWARLQVGDDLAACPVLVPPGFRLVGRVVDAAARAVPGAVVHWLDAEDAGALPWRLAQADAAGRFEVRDLAPSCTHRLVVLAEGVSPSPTAVDVAFEVHEVGGSTGEVVERAFTLSELRGRLPSEAGAESSTDPQAIALLQDTVTVESPSGSAPDLEGWSIALFDAGDDEVLAVGRCAAGSVEALAGDPRGAEHAAAFPPATEDVAVGSRPWPRRPASRRVAVRRDGDGYRVRFAAEDLPTCWLELDSLLPDATVVALDDAGHPALVLERGGATLGPLPPGRYTVAVQRPVDGLWVHHGPFALREVGARQTVSVVAVAAAAVVTLLPPPGIDVRELAVSVSSAGAPRLSRPEVGDGSLRLRLVAGDHVVHWRAPGFAARAWPIAVVPGEQALQLAGVPGQAVALEVSFAAGCQPRDGRVSADLQLVDTGSGALVWRERVGESLDERGAVRLQRRFEPGTYRLRMVDRRGARGLAEFQVPSREVVRLELR